MGKSSNCTFSGVIGWILAITLAIVITFACVYLLNPINNGLKEEFLTPPLDLPMIERNEVRDPSGSWAYRISKVKFSGHTYIVVEDHGTALLHDPDCECQTQK